MWNWIDTTNPDFKEEYIANLTSNYKKTLSVYELSKY